MLLSAKSSLAIIAIELSSARSKQRQVRSAYTMLESPKKIHNVLIVDDNVDHVDVIVEFFNALGYSATGAVTGELALQRISEKAPHIVFIDLIMADMDGFSLARSIRRNPVHAGILLVALTGSNNDEMLRLAAEADFSAFLLKPVSIQAVVTNIENGAFERMHQLRKSNGINGLATQTSIYNS